jgi:hypothetical protein
MTRELNRQTMPTGPALNDVDLSRTLLPFSRYCGSRMNRRSMTRSDSTLVIPKRDLSKTYHPGSSGLFS